MLEKDLKTDDDLEIEMKEKKIDRKILIDILSDRKK